MQLPSGMPGNFTLGGGVRVDEKESRYYLTEYTTYVNPELNTSKVIRELTRLEAARRWVWGE